MIRRTHIQPLPVAPGPPGQPRIQFLDTTSVRVSWDPPKETNGEILQYFLFYSVANDSLTEQTIHLSGSKTSEEVVKLKRGTQYIFRVKAATSSGPGENSTETFFWMNFRGMKTTIILLYH